MTVTMKAGWLEANYVDGGCWALFLSNGHLFAEMAQKGRHKVTHDRARKLADLWNMESAQNNERAA